MIRPPSNQKQYDEYWSGDPAFVQPPTPPGEKASTEEIEEFKKALADHTAKIKRARETGDWRELLIEGQEPTKFVMQPIRGDQWRWLMDESTRDDEHRMGSAMFWQLIFRCACVRVVNLGVQLPDKPVRHKELGLIAPLEIPNTLDTIDAAIVTELASVAFERAQRLNPL